jgi:hypothetical protein
MHRLACPDVKVGSLAGRRSHDGEPLIGDAPCARHDRARNRSVQRWTAIAPRCSRLKLCRHAQQQILAPERRDELDADRQPGRVSPKARRADPATRIAWAKHAGHGVRSTVRSQSSGVPSRRTNGVPHDHQPRRAACHGGADIICRLVGVAKRLKTRPEAALPQPLGWWRAL